jgi:hypothetical protein
MKKADDTNMFGKLISQTADTFVDDHPKLAANYGITKGSL